MRRLRLETHKTWQTIHHKFTGSHTKEWSLKQVPLQALKHSQLVHSTTMLETTIRQIYRERTFMETMEWALLQHYCHQVQLRLQLTPQVEIQLDRLYQYTMDLPKLQLTWQYGMEKYTSLN